MHPLLTEFRPQITAALVREAELARPLLRQASEDADQVLDQLVEYSSRGKMIRGALVLLGGGLYGRGPDRVLMQGAAALELTQSFLLIHDDIMDQDDVRRGGPAIHALYRGTSGLSGAASARFGDAMGICVGDVAAMLALAAANAAAAEAGVPGAGARFATEIASVGLAQMNDVRYGMQSADPDDSEVERVYRFKTGRYTFSLPLLFGAALAGASAEDQDALARAGEELGIAFQLRDDEIGVFGRTAETGKPEGADLTENKKTILRRMILQDLPDSERWFGRDLQPTDLDALRELATSTGLSARYRARMELHLRRGLEILEPYRSKWDPDASGGLEALARYSVERRS